MREGTLLIPLAGEGQRFKNEGYQAPKPLIEVSGLPMIIQAARALPDYHHKVFLCRKDHLESSTLENTITTFYPQAQIITVPSLTDGQASTCLLAEEYIAPESPLTIGACDNSMLYRLKAFDALFARSDVDAVIWTFRNNAAVSAHPYMYGWVEVDENRFARRISCKVPISSWPMNDHAIIGAFSFKRAKDLFSSVRDLVQKNRRVNNEFYLDESINILIENGFKVAAFEVEHYICWGTPNDLRTYQYWQSFFNISSHHPYRIER